MNEEKLRLYQELVSRRKLCKRCSGLINPSFVENGIFDSNQIGPWSLWQGNLTTKILVVGQDWGDVKYLIEHKGRDRDNNPTNQNLIKLLASIGIKIEGPDSRIENDLLFFTNAILCLKQGGLSASVKEEWFVNCGELFLKPLIEIIRPKIIIGLGKRAYDIIMRLYRLRKDNFKKAVEENKPIQITKDIFFFAAYHCGVRGININRAFSKQLEDWGRIKNYLE